MLDVLGKDWVEGILLICFNFKVNVTVTIFGLAESNLVVKLCLLECLSMGNHH